MKKLIFEKGFKGTYYVNGNEVAVNKDSGLRPYDMTYGAIAGCFYSTFLKVLKQEGLRVDKTEIIIDGEKRETIPTTLKNVDIYFLTTTNEDRAKVKECFDVAYNECSMIQMVKYVASVNAKIDFK